MWPKGTTRLVAQQLTEPTEWEKTLIKDYMRKWRVHEALRVALEKGRDCLVRYADQSRTLGRIQRDIDAR